MKVDDPSSQMGEIWEFFYTLTNKALDSNTKDTMFLNKKCERQILVDFELLNMMGDSFKSKLMAPDQRFFTLLQ